MYQKSQITEQTSPTAGSKGNVSSQKTLKKELGLEEEKEDPNLFPEMNKTNVTNQYSGHGISNAFSNQGFFDSEAGPEEQSYFEKIFKDEKMKGNSQTTDAFGFPIGNSGTKKESGANAQNFAFRTPFLEENKAEFPSDQSNKQYSYLNSFFPSIDAANPAEMDANQAETRHFLDMAERGLTNQMEVSKSMKGASDEKIIRKVMGKVAGPRNLQLPAQGLGSLHDRRPATTRPAFRHVWNYRSTSKLKPYESSVGPDVEEEDAENDDEEDASNVHNRRNTVTDFTQSNQKQVIEAIPKSNIFFKNSNCANSGK